ncbi:Na+/H+ antiporter, subunit D [Thermogladius calderae 1633]|uniref:Na+/H+ antiporter, subunit D n=1 Tax=Thermogladius calderae (strain DSM 22663 / VKM B-2946 / 1633) TaxID=1184251 RepID=I3TF80_THEC1|nr:proton-conducting transporter membrane subunit [Thermogladius calderae]AFK51418.1 Na+/H+ antiporter, subunit D [Thermogladius calderae 1633]
MPEPLFKALVDALAMGLVLAGALSVDSRPRLSRALRLAGFAVPLVSLVYAPYGLLWFQYFFLVLSFLVSIGVSLHNEDYYRVVYGSASYPQAVIDLSLVLLEVAFSSVNLIELFVAWFTLDLVLLLVILLEKGMENYRVAVTYIVLSMLPCDLSLFTFWVLVSARTGVYEAFTASFSELAATPASVGLVPALLLVAGFTAKLAQFPIHMWLPIVHPEAPSHGSAILSGLVVKLGAFMLLMTQTLFQYPAVVNAVLVAQGLVSSLYGFLAASAQDDLKRLLAYSTIGHTGVITVLLGLRGLLPVDTALLAVLYVFYHGLTKTLGFLNAGLLEQVAGSHNLYDLGYVDRVAPEATTPAVVAAMSLAGAPPTLGFTMKALTIYAVLTVALSRAASPEGPAWWALVVAAALVVSSVLSVIYSVKLVASYTSFPARAGLNKPEVGRLEVASERFLSGLIIASPALALLVPSAPAVFVLVSYAALAPFVIGLHLRRAALPEEKPWATGVEL